MSEVCKKHCGDGWYDSTKDCYICELEAEVERLEKALEYVAYYGLDDCEKASRDMRAVAKAALLEGEDE